MSGPAGGLEGPGPDFEVSAAIEDSSGWPVGPDGAAWDECPLTVKADVAVAGGRPDCQNATLSLFINGELAHRYGLGPLKGGSPPDQARYEHRWSPPACGQYDISIVVQDGDDAANRTLVTLPRLSVRSRGPDLGVAGLSVTPGEQYGGSGVVVSAVIVNNGTGDAVCGTVEFRLADPDGGPPVPIGSLDGLEVPAGASTRVGLGWTLPEIGSESENRTVEAAVDGVVRAAVPLTILKSRPVLVIESLSVPEGLRVGDEAVLSARVANTGTVSAENLSADFSDGNISLASEGLFDLSAGGVEQVRVRASIPGPGDAVHRFSVRVRDASLDVRRFIGHKLTDAAIEIAGFCVDRETVEPADDGSEQGILLELRLRNTGELPGTAHVWIQDGRGRCVVEDNIVDAKANNTTVRRYLWLVRSAGRHDAYVRVTSGNSLETCATSVDIPQGAAEADLAPLAALGTAALIFVYAVGALAARSWKKRAGTARPFFLRARKPPPAPDGERIDIETRYDRRYSVGREP